MQPNRGVGFGIDSVRPWIGIFHIVGIVKDTVVLIDMLRRGFVVVVVVVFVCRGGSQRVVHGMVSNQESQEQER